MDDDVRRSEELRRAEEARAERRAEQARAERRDEEIRAQRRADEMRSERRSDETWAETRHLDAPRTRDEGYAHRIAYDPGPSGTAVAGLIIGLIALAVALYAAFAPRETVREGSQAVTTAWEQAVDGDDQAAPAPAQTQPAQPQSRPAATPPAETDNRVVAELQKQVAGLKEELKQLRENIVQGDQARPAEQK